MIYFYPHSYLRDRQLDTIKYWPNNEVVNPEIAHKRVGAQVSRTKATNKKKSLVWKKIIPLVNIKRRPRDAPEGAVIYVWGGLIVTGPFIVDIDNPWSLVGYNLRAMPMYRYLIKKVLLSSRCKEIRCMSNACRKSLKELFGEAVYEKAFVHYPRVEQVVQYRPMEVRKECRFLFVSTQFSLKGGGALLRAFGRAYKKVGQGRLDVITHIPESYLDLAKSCDGIVIHPANYTRDKIHDEFMLAADVLIHPTYADSFGMVVLEALSHGLAIIATDVYAINEMVINDVNGFLLPPPISNWDGVLPSETYYNFSNIDNIIKKTDTSYFEMQLEDAITRFMTDKDFRAEACNASIRLMGERFT